MIGSGQVPASNITSCGSSVIVMTIPSSLATGSGELSVTTGAGQGNSNRYYTVLSSDYNVSFYPYSITVQPGGTATFTATFQSYDGLSPTAQLSFSGGPCCPAAHRLTLSAPSVHVPATGTITQTVPVTAAPGQCPAPTTSRSPAQPAQAISPS